jgi:hypothetical protein
VEECKPLTVGGVTSEGMLCDAPMLGWVGGGAGAAALLPDSYNPAGPRAVATRSIARSTHTPIVSVTPPHDLQLYICLADTARCGTTETGIRPLAFIACWKHYKN